MNKSSLLPDLFFQNPNYSSELGRLVEVCVSKYADCMVLDIGANYGDSVAIVKSVADVPVLCFEGDASAFKLLRRNLEQFRSVEAFPVYLGERCEDLMADVEKTGWNATLIPNGRNTSNRISIKSLDTIVCGDMDLYSKCKVMKIDTEGFDCRIIRGAIDFIKTSRPVIFFEYNRDNMRRICETGIETLWRLRELGYDRILYFDCQGRLVLCTCLSDENVVRDLHEYADGKTGMIYYFDLCLFHREDDDIAIRFERSERIRRSG